MKKLHLFIILLFLAGTMYAQQLSYRLANPRIIRVFDAQYFEFDVQIKCSQAGTYLWANTVKLNFNNTTFTPNISLWGVTKIGAFATNTGGFSPPPKYTVTATITGTAPNKVVNIALTGQVTKEGNGPNAADFTEVPVVYTTFITIDAPLADITGDAIAGMSFWQSGMNGFQQYISGPTTFTLYTNPNLYEGGDFLNSYTGRLYSSAYGWSQIGGAINNVQYNNWATPVKTTVWDGTATIPGGSLSNAKALRIDNPATLTIPSNGQLTVTGATEINTPGGLTIQSDATGTGSLITGSVAGIGSAIAQRYMTTGAWHMVSSPLSGQAVSDFLSTNANIPTLGANRGIMDYNPTTNSWNPFFTDGLANGSLGGGKGFSMRSAANGNVTFTGSLQAGTQLLTTVANMWNCVGNPYTSAIGINSGGSSLANFLDVNAANLDPLNGAVYVWDQPDANNGTAGLYTAISNVPNPVGYTVQQGQGFFVKMATGVTSLSFTSAMQVHNPGLTLKSTKGVWPTIKLVATAKNLKSSTIIAFNSGMTRGLDPTYDAGLFKGGVDLSVYTKLVDDNGSPFAIQALPGNEYESMIIPVGIDSKTGGDVVFSSELFNLPSGCKVILEDKLNKTFTDLSVKSYQTTIAANSSITDRFFIHTSNQTTGIADAMADKLSAYAIRNIEIRVKGSVSKQAVATLYDIQGRAVVVKNLEEGSMNIIPTPNIKTGIYMLYVKDNEKVQAFKIPVKE
jgi:hypothetical protein